MDKDLADILTPLQGSLIKDEQEAQQRVGQKTKSRPRVYKVLFLLKYINTGGIQAKANEA